MKSPRKNSWMVEEHIYILPTRNGLIYVLGTICVFFLAALTGNDLINILGLFLLTLFVIGMLQTNRNLKGIRVTEVKASPVPVGDCMTVVVTLINEDTEPSFALDAELDIGERTLNAMRGLLPTKSKVTLEVAFPAEKRGVKPLPSMRLFTYFPVGLFYAWKWVKLDQEYVIYPRPSGNITLTPIPVTHGEAVKHRYLEGEDFSGHRSYQQGDSQRHIDWKARARGLPLLVKQFEEGTQDGFALRWEDLDELGTEARLSQLALWAHQCYWRNDSYALVLPNVTLPPGTGIKHFQACLRELARFGQPDEA